MQALSLIKKLTYFIFFVQLISKYFVQLSNYYFVQLISK